MMNNKKFLRFLALFLTVAVINSCIAPIVYAANDDNSEKTSREAENEVNNELHITDVAGLLKFADACRIGDDSQNLYVVLDSDIDLTGVADFTGIDSFAGHFNGNGHTIKGINLTNESGAIGFFGYIEEGAVVENLTVDGTIYSSDKNNYIGLIAGTNAGTINNCVSRGIVTGTGNTAGITGYNGGTGIIIDCTNEAKAFSLKMVAGIAGENRGSISGCTNNGDIDADSSWLELEDDSVTSFSIDSIMSTIEETIDVGIDIGGVVGYSVGSISNCQNNGIVGYQHSGKNVGGIVGRFCGTIDGCVNGGKVYGKQDVGGIAGQFEPTIMKTGESLSDYIKDLENLSSKLADDTAAASNSAANTVSDVASSVQKNGDQISEDINTVDDKITNRISDNASNTKRRIDGASDSIRNLQDRLANTDPEKIKEEKANDIANLDYNTVINRIENLSEDVNRAQKTIGEYDSSWVGNEIKGEIDSKANSSIADINDTTGTLDERVNTVTDDTVSDLNEISANIASTTATLSSDINAINDKIADITSLAEEQIDNLRRISEGEDIIEDYSAIDSQNEEASRLTNCKNLGYVNGDRNAGGIAGAIAIEGTDSNDDVNKVDGNKYVTIGVLENSSSNGIIELRRENAGGIVGNASIGLIRNCCAKDRIISEEGNYIGGVVGYAKGTVTDCYSASVLEGANYVGGIAGAAQKLRNCYTMTSIVGDINWGGEIIGDVLVNDEEDVTVAHSNMMSSIFNNYYANDTFGGINNVSYNGIAEAVSYQTLLASAVQDYFKELNVYYYDTDYKLVSTQTVIYGSSINNLKYPELDTEENMHLIWNGLYGDTVEGNLFLVAETADDVTVLASSLASGNRPIAFAQGIYYENSELVVVHDKDNAGPTPANEDSVVDCYEVNLKNVSEKENPVSELRFYVGDAQKVNIYEYIDGVWEPKDVEIAGSYAQCELIGLNGKFAVEKTSKTSTLIILAGCIVFIVVLVGILIIINKKTSKLQKKR